MTGVGSEETRRDADGGDPGDRPASHSTPRNDTLRADDTLRAEDSHESADGEPDGAGEQSFGWRGWVLVAALVVSLVVVPWVIVALPRAHGFLESIGLGFRDAYLVLPLVPALGLGLLGVWAALANRRSGSR